MDKNRGVLRLPETFSSGKLAHTSVPTNIEPRKWWLSNNTRQPPPWISSSSFISREMIEHLMRHKRDLAIGGKSRNTGSLGDRAITNMEGMLHTFVIPIVAGYIHGDYYYRGSHRMKVFGADGRGTQLARPVLISALIHPDFETEEVMWSFCSLREIEAGSLPKLSRVLDEIPGRGPLAATSSVMIPDYRIRNTSDWDDMIQTQTLAHFLGADHRERWRQAKSKALMSTEIVERLELAIRSGVPQQALQGCTFRLSGHGSVKEEFSLEVLFAVVLEQVKNELSALEHICRKTGYIYTFDPAVIFRSALRGIGRELMMLVHAAAVTEFASHNTLDAMEIFAYNDFESPEALAWIEIAVKGHNVQVMSKNELFSGRNELYSPPARCKDAVLVLHNNSDAFGQNIEFEIGSGSMDAAIGQFSSAAASLQRDRDDLLAAEHMMFWPSLK